MVRAALGDIGRETAVSRSNVRQASEFCRRQLRFSAPGRSGTDQVVGAARLAGAANEGTRYTPDKEECMITHQELWRYARTLAGLGNLTAD